MKTYIILLRGINVGGKRKVKMIDLKQLLEGFKYENITTYIQSGNIIVNSSKNADFVKNEIIVIIEENFGFKVPVIVIEASDFKTIKPKNPFLASAEANEEIDKLHVTFLGEQPKKELIEQLEAINFSPDTFKILNTEVFIKCNSGYSKSKLTNQFFEKKLKIETTTRNWKTVLKLTELLEKYE